MSSCPVWVDGQGDRLATGTVTLGRVGTKNGRPGLSSGPGSGCVGGCRAPLGSGTGSLNGILVIMYAPSRNRMAQRFGLLHECCAIKGTSQDRCGPSPFTSPSPLRQITTVSIGSLFKIAHKMKIDNMPTTGLGGSGKGWLSVWQKRSGKMARKKLCRSRLLLL